MGAIKIDPFVLALVAGILQYLSAKHPEYRDAINSVLVALGYGGGAHILRAVNGNGKVGNGGSTPV